VPALDDGAHIDDAPHSAVTQPSSVSVSPVAHDDGIDLRRAHAALSVSDSSEGEGEQRASRSRVKEGRVRAWWWWCQFVLCGDHFCDVHESHLCADVVERDDESAPLGGDGTAGE
jgi:hypothetical protein